MQSKENNTEHLISGRFWNPPYALCFFAWCTVCASRLLLLCSSLDCLPRLPLSIASVGCKMSCTYKQQLPARTAEDTVHLLCRLLFNWQVEDEQD